jgi:hypothetical protein
MVHEGYEGARAVMMTPYEALAITAYVKNERDTAFHNLDALNPEDRTTTESDLRALDGVIERIERILDRPRTAATSRFVVPEGENPDEYLYDPTSGYYNGEHAEERRLIEWGSYGRTSELKALLSPHKEKPITPRVEDILELWSVFRGAEEYHDGESTLQDFARWILGNPIPPDENTLSGGEPFEPCKVLW